LSLRQVISDNNLDGFMVTKTVNCQYLAGFTGSNAILIITEADNCLITDFRYIEQAEKETQGFRIVKPIGQIEDALADLVSRLGIKRLGYEENNLTCRQFSVFKEKIPNTEFVPYLDAIEKIRQVKDSTEIQTLKEAAALTDMAFNYILEIIRPGIKEAEIALEIEYFMRKRGAQKAAFDTIVASGYRGALPHGIASDKKISDGELVVLDFGAVVCGYHSDMTRTIMAGEADIQHRKVYDIVLKAQEKAMAAIRPGVRCSDIDLIARDIITANGYGANFGHGLGHSVGLEIHEKPSFSPKDETILEPGMIITVEPGIYLSDWGGVRIEDLILVTETGCELLSHSPKNLVEITKI
jgi:Xaa-Pro aminopeptidase